MIVYFCGLIFNKRTRVLATKITMKHTGLLSIILFMTSVDAEPPNKDVFWSESRAKAFLDNNRYKRQTLDCSDEDVCEHNILQCADESLREEKCRGHTCNPGSTPTCYMSKPCPGHDIEVDCTDNACYEKPCKNGGECMDTADDYVCSCATGYTGKNCEEDIDDCESNMCENGATCTDYLNGYNCTCEVRYNGTYCEKDLCSPLLSSGADIVFLLDTSLSQISADKRAKNYLKDFISYFPLGSGVYQVALVTVSFEVSVHFYLNELTNISSVNSAIDKIEYENASSFVGKGLKFIREEVLSEVNGARTDVQKYVVVLTDGLSSDVEETRLQADKLKAEARILAVGVGDDVYHEELMNTASDGENVFAISTQDALSYIRIRHMHDTCPDCYRGTSDVAIMLDNSRNISPVQYYRQRKAVEYLFRQMPVGVNQIHVNLAQFATSVNDIFSFETFFTSTEMIIALHGLKQDTSVANTTYAINCLKDNTFSSVEVRQTTRKVAVLVTDGNFDTDSMADVFEAVNRLRSSNVTVIVVAVNEYVEIGVLHRIASDPVFAYVVDDDESVLLSLIGSLDFDVCDID